MSSSPAEAAGSAQTRLFPAARPASSMVARYTMLFNQRDWEGLRPLLANDVKLKQSSYAVCTGSAEIGMFFGIYSKLDPVWLAPAWLEGREVIAVSRTAPRRIRATSCGLNGVTARSALSRLRYVTTEAEVTLAR